MVKKILVLGGGIGGIAVANILADKLKESADITLIDRKKYFQFPPSYPWLMIGKRKPEQVQKELTILSKKGINVINEDIISIDTSGKKVRTETSEYSGDYMVISLGAQYNIAAIPGFSDYAHHIYDLDSAIAFRDLVKNFKHGTIAIGISRLPFKCPAAPYETAFLLDDYFTKEGVRAEINIEFFTPEPLPVPSVGPDVGNRVLELLRSRNINYHPKLKLAEITDKELIFDNQETLNYDLLFAVPPHEAPKPVADAGLTDVTGWIPANGKNMETKIPGVYAIGDVASIQTPHGYVPYLSKAGVFAHAQAEVVANNIANLVLGKSQAKEWDGEGGCFMETSIGEGTFMKGEFYAQPKPRIDYHEPGKVWHMQKVVFEKYWMRHWF